MLLREIAGVTARLVVEHEIDAALAEQAHVLGAMPGNALEAEQSESAFQYRRVGGGELDELEAVEAHRIARVLHVLTPRKLSMILRTPRWHAAMIILP